MKSVPIGLPSDVELHPDAWERFEHAVDTVMRSPPKHRTGKATRTQRESSPANDEKREAKQR